MKDQSKTKQALIQELASFRQMIEELEQSESGLKKEKEELKMSVARFRSYFDLPMHGIAIISPEKGWIEVNDRICSMIGYSRNEITRMTWSEMTHPDDLVANLEQYNRVLSGQIEHYNMDKRFIRKDGKVVWTNIFVGCVRKVDGSVDHMIALVEDITDRKRVEEALRKNRRQLTDIIEFLPDATLAIDKEKRVIIWNKAVEKMTGIPAAEMIGQGDYAYTIPFYGEARPQLMDLVFEHQEEIAARYPNITREGDTLIAEVFCKALNDNKGAWVFAKASPLHDQAGNIVGAIESIRDITERKRTEDSLCKSEEKYRLIADNMADVIVITDMNLRYTYVSPSVMRLSGFTVEEVMEQIPEQTMTIESSRVIYKTYEEEMKLEASGKANLKRTRIMELEIYRKDGFTFSAELSLSFLRDTDQKPIGILSVTRDISERKRAEEALEKSVAQLRTLINTIPDLVWLKDSDGVYLECNHRFEQFFGAKKKDIVGKTDYDFVDRELADFFRENDRKAIAAGKPIRNEEEVTYANDGHREILETIKTPIFGVSGEILGVLGIGRDITERKRAEEALGESEARLREAQRIAHLGNMELDLLTKTFTWSDETFRIFEIDKDHFSASYEEFIAAIYPEDRDAVKAAYTQSLETRKPFVFSHRLLMRDGRIKRVQVQCVTHYNPEGKPLRSVGTVQDITVQKHLEEQLRQSQKMEAIGTLAGGIAHDFNNILGGIIGYTELSLMHHLKPDNPATGYLKEVLHASIRAKDLVSQIVTFSRQAEQMRQPIEIGSVIKESLKLLRASLPATIEIHQHIDDTAGVIMADPTQIQQVILNLCTNAYHAMGEKGGIIEISLNGVVFGADKTIINPDLKEGVKYQELTVHDTGHGINPGIIDRIFDPFFTTKKTGEGTGLGLAVVYGIVRGHDGAITVDSKPDKGTTFKIYIPAIKIFEADDAERKIVLCGGTEKIIFVDDEKFLTHIFRIQLENLGYIVRDYNDPMEAIADFKSNKANYDLVITDRAMPHMDGVELAHALIEIRPDIPVILCTGGIETIEQAVLKKAGIRKMIRKPLTIDVLAEAIRQVLDAR